MILAIETSAEPASIALLTASGKLISRSFVNHNKVNTILADQLSEILENHELLIILVGAGPGSYSGARVGLATAEAIAIAHNAKVILVPSIRGVSEKGCTLIGDARQGAYFIQSPSAPEPTVMSEKELASSLLHTLEDHSFITFEEPSKLSNLPLEDADIISTHSSAVELVNFWNTLSPNEKETLEKSEQEIIYLRPPNITKPKNPFS